MMKTFAFNSFFRVGLLAALLLFGANHCIAQFAGGENGIPVQNDFLPADYQASGQNFSITADRRGVLYFANFTGILEFDGTTWRTILTKERTKVNTLVTDKNGRIFAGTRGEIGYLQPDNMGSMQFTSLNAYLKPYHITSPDVISSYATNEGVYFVTNTHVILLNGKTLKATGAGSPVVSAFHVNNTLYAQLKQGGLKIFNNGRFVSIPGGNQFTEQVNVAAMVSTGNGEVLIGSGNQGLYRLTPAGITPYNNEANTYLKANIISYATSLKDGSIAIGTVNGGVVVENQNGTIRQIFSKATTGLYNNNVHFLYEDENHGFWVATEKNISRIEMPSYLSFYNSKKNVNGNVMSTVRFQNKLYIATDQGLMVYDTRQMQFKAVPGLQMPCLALLNVSDHLLVATSTGVYSYNVSSIQNIATGYTVAISHSAADPDRVYAGQLNGVIELKSNGGRFVKTGTVPGITDEVREIMQDEDGALWFQVPSKGLIRYSKGSHAAILYNQNHGLPYNSGNHLNLVGGKMLVGTIKGAYQFNKSKNRFEHINLFKGDSAANHNWINQMIEDKHGILWTTSGNSTDISAFKKTATSYAATSAILATLKNQQIYSIFPDDNGLGVWLGSNDNLIYVDTRNAVSFSAIKPVLIRSVKVNADSVLFSGTYFNKQKLPVYQQNKTFKTTLNYKDNNVSFSFSSPSAAGNRGMLYNYYLEGFDADTTGWADQQEKEYSNLPAGTYTFHVQAKNIFGFKSQPATFQFTITKPFYQTIWAYIIYGLLLIGIIITVARLRSLKLLKEKEKLEGLIKDRTAEVITQKEAIESQSLELAGKNDELEKINQIVKSINAEIDFDSLLQTILEKARIIRGAEKAAMLVYDKGTNSFKFKASYGYNATLLEQIHMTAEEAETRYLSAAEEIYEDIYFIKSVKSISKDEQLSSFNKAKSSLMMIIKLNYQIHAFMIIENWQKRNAFEERDFSLLKNLKEHFVAAIIKTTLLEDIQETLSNLKNTQEQLIRQEKLASIGQLTKGIVDRILNPLNYINNFSSLSADLTDESLELISKPQMDADDKEEVVDLLSTVKSNMNKVHEHGSSASRIVKGMEKILREKSTGFIKTDINRLVETSIKQVTQEGRKEFPGVDVAIRLNLDPKREEASVLLHEMNTVLNNLLINAYYVVAEKHKTHAAHAPQITVSTIFSQDQFEISIRDNGKGISAVEQKQLFQPFFTTKPTAKGTGLGLYLSQEIIKEHKGSITVKTEENSYTEFIITIPKL